MTSWRPAGVPDIVVRDAVEGDCKTICELNLAEVQHTSPMDAARAACLASLACYHRVASVDGEIAGFLLAMRDGAPYDNDNFAWFARRYARFIYIDRVVVSSAFRGLRVGSLLYDDLFRYAREEDVPLVTCEYNIVPPNVPSRRFHDKFGFREQGTQWLAGGSKQVSLQVAATREAATEGAPHVAGDRP